VVDNQHVFGQNAAGDLIHYYWSPAPGWQAENLTSYPNIGAAFQLASDPVAINLQSGATPTQHVFGRNAAGHLIHYYWSPAPGWQAENLTQRTGASPISPGSRPLVPVVCEQRARAWQW
jgi:hypothetical protein